MGGVTKNFLPSMMIICGGRGRRLGPLSDNIPKPLVIVGDKPMLHHKLDYYNQQGFSHYTVCTGYKADLIAKSLGGYTGGAAIQIDEQELSAGILKRIYAGSKLAHLPAIISYGDTIARVDFEDLYKSHQQSGLPCTIVTAPIVHPFGLVENNDSGLVLSFREKPVLKYFIGYTVISADFFDYIPTKFIDMDDGFGLVNAFKYLIERRLLNSYFHEGPQITFNTPEELRSATKEIDGFLTL